MELATRIYNTLIADHNQIVALGKNKEEIDYWRLILRLAALCHDMGHLPFSHTAEKSLLTDGGHEGMTLQIIHSPELQALWQKVGSHAAEDIASLSQTKVESIRSPWEKVLAKIITEDSFGADRIDYLIRDGHYTGVGYGYFDYHQLIDCLRILPEEAELSLGITANGVHAVESLWIARYMMYERVYQHHKVRAFSNHMRRFIIKYFEGSFIENVDEYLEHTDYTLLTALAQAARKGDYDARCLFKQAAPFCEIAFTPDSIEQVENLEKKFEEMIFIDEIPQKEITSPFPVYVGEKRLVSCFEASPFLRAIPPGGKPICFYVHPEKKKSLMQWLKDHCVSAH